MPEPPTTMFEQAHAGPWQEVFHDPCTADWQEQWFLDGKKASITHGPGGMDFQAGPVHLDDSCHAVLWTQPSFSGDLKITYEYTKLDDTVHNVTILYLLATGRGDGPYAKDITRWNPLREVPSMNMYFDHMNTYHVSYAAYGMENTDPAEDYIRARRYCPADAQGLANTDLPPDHFRTGLFEVGVPHQITVIKRADDLFMHIQNGRQEKHCHWKTGGAAPIDEGRIGLRHMYTRGARYRDFRVSTLAPSSADPAQ